MELQYKSFKIEEKAVKDDGSLHVKFYALAFGNVDSWNDIIMPNACDEFLKSDDADRMKLCYQHDTRQVIGVITSKTADSYGLLCEADILPTETGKDVITLIKGGALNEFSIGYYADEYHYEKRAGIQEDVRILDRITIREASVVSFAANPSAVLVSAKSEGGRMNTEDVKTATDDELSAMKEAIEAEQLNRLIANI